MIKLNGHDVVPTVFPDETIQVWNINPRLFKKHNIVEWDFDYDGELISVFQLGDLLNSRESTWELSIPYLPYARQDKEIRNDTCFGLHSFSKLLSLLNVTKITCIDPHSHIALKLIKKLEISYPIQQLESAIIKTKADMLCYADEGAWDKYRDIYAELLVSTMWATKERNQLTGQITEMSLCGSPSGSVLIVDDICDGGATFCGLSQLLLRAGAAEVNLFVSHGLFSKGTQVLMDSGIKRIFTKDGEV